MDPKPSSKSPEQQAPYHGEPAPAYEATEPRPDAPADISTPAPTVNAPFNFPPAAETAPPKYYSTPSGSSGSPRVMAVPQIRPGAKSSFLPAYPPALLGYGITEASWRSFLDTISAFLTARVSGRAISHAADIAQDIGQGPAQLGKSLVSHVKSIGSDIAGSARRGDVVGVVASVLGGAISLPIAAAFGAAGTVLALPSSAIGAVARKPKSPLDRAAAYAAVANDKWFHRRGLHAQLLDTEQMARLIGMSGGQLLQRVTAAGNKASPGSASQQLDALLPLVEAVEIQEGATLYLEANTLWLVIMEV